MSDHSERPRSGEFVSLTPQRAQDGTLEYVLGDESSSPVEDASPPRQSNNTKRVPSKTPLMLGGAALLVIVAVATAFFMQGAPEAERGSQEEGEHVSFKAYSGTVAPADPAPPVIKPRRVEVDEEIPEELAGWDLDENDEEVIVIEEYGGEVEPAAKVTAKQDIMKPGQAYPTNHETPSLAAHGRARYASPEQRKLLRQFNEQLDRGERPIIPKANIPGSLLPISPKLQRIDNVTGPKFRPGKLRTRPPQKNAQEME